MSADILATCSGCGRQVKAKLATDGETLKLPRGWRRIGGEMLCNDQGRGETKKSGCISRRYYVRSFRAQITGMAATEARTWEECRRAMAESARMSAAYGNWFTRELFAHDPAAATPPAEWPRTKDGKPKLPPLPVVNGYRPDLFPRLSGATISALAQMVRGWYSERRFEMFVALDRSIENYRFGFLPIEVRAADWKIKQAGDRYEFHGLTLAPGKSWAVSVYCDPRNLAHLKACANGTAEALALKVVRRTKQPIPGTNGKPTRAWFCRVSVLLPRTPRRASHAETTLTLGHDAESLLYGSLEDGSEFEYPGWDVRKMIVGGDKADRKRQQQDSLYRGVMPRRKLKRWRQDRTRASESRARKIDYQVHCAAAALVRWCRSRGVTSVDYEITDRGFVSHFPWRKLRDYIACGLEAADIALHVVGQESIDNGSDSNDSVALAEPGRETT